MVSITIQELHARTREIVRAVGASRDPVAVTDRGRTVAVLTAPPLSQPRRRRILRPEYAALPAETERADVLEDLAAVRGER